MPSLVSATGFERDAFEYVVRGRPPHAASWIWAGRDIGLTARPPTPHPTPLHPAHAHQAGARLDWARQQSFASADGCVVTAELQPAALALGSPMAWQACWAVACPVNGQAWKSLGPKQR